MDLTKSREFFDPATVTCDIHIIGCGAIGSAVADHIARLGADNIHLWDFDTVSEHNIANQNFNQTEIGIAKTSAVATQMWNINPSIKIKKHTEGWNGEPLKGYIFMCVDSMEIRNQIVDALYPNMAFLKAVFDFRMTVDSGQHYTATGNTKSLDILKASMDYSTEEAQTEAKVNACNMELSIIPTPRALVALGIANFINHANTGKIKKMINIAPFEFSIVAFDA